MDEVIPYIKSSPLSAHTILCGVSLPLPPTYVAYNKEVPSVLNFEMAMSMGKEPEPELKVTSYAPVVVG